MAHQLTSCNGTHARYRCSSKIQIPSAVMRASIVTRWHQIANNLEMVVCWYSTWYDVPQCCKSLHGGLKRQELIAMGVRDAERIAQHEHICPSICARYEGIGGILGKDARGERASSALVCLPEPKDRQLSNHSGEHGFWKQVGARRKQS